MTNDAAARHPEDLHSPNGLFCTPVRSSWVRVIPNPHSIHPSTHPPIHSSQPAPILPCPIHSPIHAFIHFPGGGRRRKNTSPESIKSTSKNPPNPPAPRPCSAAAPRHSPSSWPTACSSGAT